MAATNPDPTQNYRSEFQRLGLMSPDPDAAALRPVVLTSVGSFRLAATSDRPGSVLSLRIYLLDSDSQPIGIVPLQFTASLRADWAGRYSGTPNLTQGDGWYPLGGATGLVLKVDDITASAAWDVRGCGL